MPRRCNRHELYTVCISFTRQPRKGKRRVEPSIFVTPYFRNTKRRCTINDKPISIEGRPAIIKRIPVGPRREEIIDTNRPSSSTEGNAPSFELSIQRFTIAKKIHVRLSLRGFKSTGSWFPVSSPATADTVILKV